MISRKQCMQVSIGCTTCGQTPHPHLAVCMSEDALKSHLRSLCSLHSRGLLFWGDGSALRLERRLLCCNRCHKWHHVLDVVFVFQHPPPFLRDGRSDRSNGTRLEPIPIRCSDCDVLARRQSCPVVGKQPASMPMDAVCSVVLTPWREEESVAFVAILWYDGPNTACKCNGGSKEAWAFRHGPFCFSHSTSSKVSAWSERRHSGLHPLRQSTQKEVHSHGTSGGQLLRCALAPSHGGIAACASARHVWRGRNCLSGAWRYRSWQ
jgi:hypothetical protein